MRPKIDLSPSLVVKGHSVVPLLIGMVDQSVGMGIVDHQESIQWLQNWVEHGWQLAGSHDQVEVD